MNIYELTIQSAKRGLRGGDFSCEELIKEVFVNIRKHEKNIHAFLLLREDEALSQARLVDEKIKNNSDLLPLEGIPVALKDNICVKGEATTAASKILENYKSVYSATVVEKLIEAGAIIIGKTNLDEFAHGASTENSAYGPTKNPWDTSRAPGGSSGGSAAAVAAGFCLAALGTDTGGSVRQPAGWCNLYGLRPTYGRISRYGLMAMTSSTDTPGIITKTAKDSAYLLSVLAGVDKNDSTSLPNKTEDYFEKSKILDKGFKVGVPKEYFDQSSDKETIKIIKKAIDDIADMGGDIKEVSLPHTKYGVPAYYIITPSEISSNLARYDGIRYGYSSPEAGSLHEVYTKSRGQGFGSEAKRRTMLGTYSLSSGYYDAYYKKAQKVRTVIANEYKNVLQNVDFVVSPTSPHPAIKLGQKSDDPLAMYLEDVYLATPVMAGSPALSVPAGFVNNLPVGLQIMGKQLDEVGIFALARAYEENHNWVGKHPNL